MDATAQGVGRENQPERKFILVQLELRRAIPDSAIPKNGF
jgi:hypothetical protein